MERKPPYQPAAPPMDEQAFWAVWDALVEVHGGDVARIEQALGAGFLHEVDDEVIQAFQARFIEVTGRLHTWRHRAAIELYLQQRLDDEYTYICAGPWLVAHGREVFERIVADADALADLEWAGPSLDPDPWWTQPDPTLYGHVWMIGGSLGRAVMHRRPNWPDEDFDRSLPAHAPLGPPPGEQYVSAVAAKADLPRMSARAGDSARLELPDWQRRNYGPFPPPARPKQVVDIWIPLTSPHTEGRDDFPFPFLDQVERFLGGLVAQRGEWIDDGEEVNEHYVYSVWKAPRAELLAVADEIAALPGMPPGVFAIVTNQNRSLSGEGRRIDLTGRNGSGAPESVPT